VRECHRGRAFVVESGLDLRFATNSFCKAGDDMRIYPRLFVCIGLAFLAGCGKQATNDKAASAALISAQQLFQAGQYQSARGEIETAIKADPNAGDAHLLAGQIAEKLGDLQSALSEYVSADVTGAGKSDGRHAAAALLLRARAYNLADEWIGKCIADRPGDKSMKAYRALLEQRLGDAGKARADAEDVLTKNAGESVANAVLAEQALHRQDPAEALVRIEAGLSTDASDQVLLQLKAEALLQQQSPDKAIDIYQALVMADPTSPDYRSGLAELIAKTSDAGQGEAVLRAGIAAAPTSVDMRMRLVAFLARHRDKSAVVAELRSAIEAANPASTAYDIALADIYARDKESEAAAKVLHDAIARTESSPAHAAAQIALARLMVASDNTVAARTMLEQLLNTNPAEDEVIAVRGQILLKEHNAAAAIQDFLSIATHQPANPAAYDLLAGAYLQNDQPGEAIAALKRILSLGPANDEILHRIVDIQSGLGDLAAAYRTTEDFVLRNPESTGARILQIRLAIRSKDWTSAETALVNLREQPQTEEKITVALEAEIDEAQNRHAEAANLYERLIVWKDNNTFNMAAAEAFARTSVAAGQTSQAIQELMQHSSVLAPTEVASYQLVLATLYDGLGQDDQARTHLEEAIKQAPSLPAPYLWEAQVFSRKKNYASALAALDGGLSAGAPKGVLLLARAQVQSASGRVDDAIATYRQLLRVNPGSAVAANELANVLADQSPPDKAALRDARDLLRKNVAFKTLAMIDTLAWSDYRLGEFQEAKDLLSRVRADQSTNPQVRFHYGAVLVALGEDAKGQKIIRTTLNDSYPGRNEAEQMVKD
jgi:tetratricopeptide (TPR) repeat protein